ncbi:MAG: polysaccharide deacetylase family protein [Dysgonamonadaceae bacterium]|jgi:peptidoglycan-N-acetylmuramic acid deacetylase|nr:polysaccharide deacetylase family protein [Dysgonamonadaceae bacterium]
MEQKEQIDDESLEKVSKILDILVGTIQNFSILLKPLTKASPNTIVSWGLVPNDRELTPRAACDRKLLNDNDAIFVGNTQNKSVFFTFDLGSESGYTDHILDILKGNNIKAIFFLCGGYLKEKQLIDRMIAEGHVIGNHTDKHKDLPTVSNEEMRKDIVTFQKNFQKIYPYYVIKLFRPPFGRFDQRTLKIAKVKGLRTILWSSAIVDWGETPTEIESNVDKIITRLHPGAILLLHICNSSAPGLLKELLFRIAEKTYQVGNPSEL